MTKVFEEVKRGRVSVLLERLTTEKIRGEFTLVVAGRGEEERPQGINEEVRKRRKKDE